MPVTNASVCCIRRNAALSHAFTKLKKHGLTVTAYPTRSTGHLLLPVPSFTTGSAYLEELLPTLPKDVVIYGGNLDIPLLSNHRTVDFLQDPYYLAENAAITAACATTMIKEHTDPQNRSALILGWGRIGKCLGPLLREHGSQVTIAARKAEDLAMIHALGYDALQIRSAGKDLTRYHIIVNTIPAMILPEMAIRPGAILLELASQPGMYGENIIQARGLPGKMAPEASGDLIAQTFIRLLL